MPPPEAGTVTTTCSGPSARSVAAGPAGQVAGDPQGAAALGATVTVERSSTVLMAATRGMTAASEVTAQQVATKAAGKAPGWSKIDTRPGEVASWVPGLVTPGGVTMRRTPSRSRIGGSDRPSSSGGTLLPKAAQARTSGWKPVSSPARVAGMKGS